MRERLDSDVRKGQIADVALELVVSEGISGLTVKNIARQVGVTPPALYRHYAGKTEILAAVVDYITGVYTESRKRVLRKTAGPVTLLRELFFSQVRLFERYPAVPVFFYSDLLWREEPSLGALLNRHLEEFAAEVAEVIRQGQGLGRIRTDETPERLFIAFLGLFSSMGILAGRGLCRVDMAVQPEINWKIFENYITTADASSGRAGMERGDCEVVP
ncbi:TetR/AcrR family transcriptional regulator [Desulfovibrio sp. Huiquan2017]|uniref:TetR/AcrR family transcriptional regulator n=1 Tax=Desulfovibrio sp. Huiquan2017 TaxID=2816861 RepID=UPI001A9368CA|nr:TetR/AcrR family transcriptional regulator [Desulfovibrio sp. Huiquan2017]